MKTRIPILARALAIPLAAAGVALANGAVESPRWALSGGASDSAGEGVNLRGTLGHPVVGFVTSGGGDVALGQGFWHGCSYQIYLPLIQK